MALSSARILLLYFFQVSTDWLEEQITNYEDFVQSVDIAAFNKI